MCGCPFGAVCLNGGGGNHPTTGQQKAVLNRGVPVFQVGDYGQVVHCLEMINGVELGVTGSNVLFIVPNNSLGIEVGAIVELDIRLKVDSEDQVFCIDLP